MSDKKVTICIKCKNIGEERYFLDIPDRECKIPISTTTNYVTGKTTKHFIHCENKNKGNCSDFEAINEEVVLNCLYIKDCNDKASAVPVGVIYREKHYSFRVPHNTKLEYYVLSMVLWYDIYKNDYQSKKDSKFFEYIKSMEFECPLCEYKRINIRKTCEACALIGMCAMGQPYDSWVCGRKTKENAKKILLAIKKEVDRLIEERKEGNR